MERRGRSVADGSICSSAASGQRMPGVGLPAAVGEHDDGDASGTEMPWGGGGAGSAGACSFRQGALLGRALLLAPSRLVVAFRLQSKHSCVHIYTQRFPCGAVHSCMCWCFYPMRSPNSARCVAAPPRLSARLRATRLDIADFHLPVSCRRRRRRSCGTCAAWLPSPCVPQRRCGLRRASHSPQRATRGDRVKLN